MSFIKYINY